MRDCLWGTRQDKFVSFFGGSKVLAEVPDSLRANNPNLPESSFIFATAFPLYVEYCCCQT